uniref:Palmitoyltransferase n=1 Tax=Ditylum brightwellii TaxID=49249 RepID=A0A7S4RB24_9STRA
MGRAELCNSTIGTTFHAQNWLSLDPCGLVCITLSFSTHIYALYAIGVCLIQNWVASQVVFGVLYVPLSIMSLISLVQAFRTNPGAVPMGAKPLEEEESEGEEDEENQGGMVDEEEAEGSFVNDALVAGGASVGRDTAMSAGGGSKAKKKKAAAKKRGIRRCRKCNDNFKPPRAHHDSVTGRCIVKMDHYCPWVCNAVGALNHKLFVLFIFYTFLTSLTSLALLLMRFGRCGWSFSRPTMMPPSSSSPSSGNEDEDVSPTYAEGDEEEANQAILLRFLRYLGELAVNASVGSSEYDDDGGHFLGGMSSTNNNNLYQECNLFYTKRVLILCIVTILFLLFTLAMLIEQAEAISENTGKIARMQMRAGRAGNELRRVTNQFNEMFGGDSPHVALHWFVPVPPKFPDDVSRDRVLGYTWDIGCGDGPYRDPNASASSVNHAPRSLEVDKGSADDDGGTAVTTSLAESAASADGTSTVGVTGVSGVVVGDDESSLSTIGLTRSDSNVKKRKGA